MHEKPDLITCSPTALADLMKAATKLGAVDATAGNKPPGSGKELASRLCKGWRKGHERFLLNAYRAGRWQVEMMGKPATRPTVPPLKTEVPWEQRLAGDKFGTQPIRVSRESTAIPEDQQAR